MTVVVMVPIPKMSLVAGNHESGTDCGTVHAAVDRGDANDHDIGRCTWSWQHENHNSGP